MSYLAKMVNKIKVTSQLSLENHQIKEISNQTQAIMRKTAKRISPYKMKKFN